MFIGACAVLSALIIPAGASAASLWVSNSAPTSAPSNSCAHPGYSAIKSAILVAGTGSTVNICPGSYTEQLTVTKAIKLLAAGGAGSAKVVLPEKPVDSITACDSALEKAGDQPDQDAVSICTSGTVTMTGLTIEARWPEATCYDSLYGVLVLGGATLKATDVTVNAAGAIPINGCQGGVGIEVGSSQPKTPEVGHATLTHDTISGYQKNGITADGEGSSVKVTGTTVTGAGATPAIAQNGIQVSDGALGTIASSNISGNECDVAVCGSNALEDTQSTGVLFYGAATGSKVVSTSLEENDIGVYFASTNPVPPSFAEATVSGDVLSGNRYEGLALEQGDALVKGNTITGPGNIGIELLQGQWEPYAPTSSATGDHIEGMHQAAVEVQSDKKAGDHPGSFTIGKSEISKNAQAVVDESETFTVII
jgi:hypothetical protein